MIVKPFEGEIMCENLKDDFNGLFVVITRGLLRLKKGPIVVSLYSPVGRLPTG